MNKTIREKHRTHKLTITNKKGNAVVVILFIILLFTSIYFLSQQETHQEPVTRIGQLQEQNRIQQREQLQTAINTWEQQYINRGQNFCSQTTQGGNPPSITPIKPLAVCAGTEICAKGWPVFLSGLSPKGFFPELSGYQNFLNTMTQNKLYFTRQLAMVYPQAWLPQGEQPYILQNNGGRYTYQQNQAFFDNTHTFLDEAAEQGVYVLVDLVDMDGLRDLDLITNPLYTANIMRLPQDLYHPAVKELVLDMTRETVRELSVHDNVFYLLINSPGEGTLQDQITLQNELAQIIREEHPSALIAANPDVDYAKKVITPNPEELDVDLVLLDGAGVADINDPNSCTVETLSAIFSELQNKYSLPLLADTGGLAHNAACDRYNDVLPRLVQGAFEGNVAGFFHKGGINNDGTLDDEAMSILAEPGFFRPQDEDVYGPPATNCDTTARYCNGAYKETQQKILNNLEQTIRQELAPVTLNNVELSLVQEEITQDKSDNQEQESPTSPQKILLTTNTEANYNAEFEATYTVKNNALLASNTLWFDEIITEWMRCDMGGLQANLAEAMGSCALIKTSCREQQFSLTQQENNYLARQEINDLVIAEAFSKSITQLEKYSIGEEQCTQEISEPLPIDCTFEITEADYTNNYLHWTSKNLPGPQQILQTKTLSSTNANYQLLGYTNEELLCSTAQKESMIIPAPEPLKGERPQARTEEFIQNEYGVAPSNQPGRTYGVLLDRGAKINIHVTCEDNTLLSGGKKKTYGFNIRYGIQKQCDIPTLYPIENEEIQTICQ